MTRCQRNARPIAATWLLGLVSVASMAPSCAMQHAEPSDELGVASIALTSVPADVRCIRVDIVDMDPPQTLTRQIDVMPGQDTQLELAGLPLGLLTFTGAAFAAECSAVQPDAVSDWASAPVTAVVVAGQPASVSLVLKRNGRANVNVSFEDDISCASGETACGATCTNTATDADNCGACGNACGAGAVCAAGACACRADRTQCQSGCVSIEVDRANCGRCGNACLTQEICQMGQCVCPRGLSSCDDLCIDLQNSDLNCGVCGVMCRNGQRCTGGRCECPAGRASCNAGCVDLATDRRNCGACEHLCSAREICDQGSCVLRVP